MTEILKTPKTLFLPNIDNIKDPETKKALEKYNEIFNELITAVYSDVSRLHVRLGELE